MTDGALYPYLRRLAYNPATAVQILIESAGAADPSDYLNDLRVVIRLLVDEATMVEARLPSPNPEGAPDGEDRRDESD